MDKQESSPHLDRNEKAKEAEPVIHLTSAQPGQNGQIATSTENERENKKAVNWPAWIQALSGVAIVIITGFYTYYARQQVMELRKATTATQNAADAATSAAKTARDALHISERAYLTLAGPTTDMGKKARGYCIT